MKGEGRNKVREPQGKNRKGGVREAVGRMGFLVKRLIKSSVARDS